jgi:hypothetical protein
VPKGVKSADPIPADAYTQFLYRNSFSVGYDRGMNDSAGDEDLA